MCRRNCATRQVSDLLLEQDKLDSIDGLGHPACLVDVAGSHEVDVSVVVGQVEVAQLRELLVVIPPEVNRRLRSFTCRYAQLAAQRLRSVIIH